MRSPRPNNNRNGKPDGSSVTLEHCPPGDPCERTLILRPDGTVWFSALCAEMVPVASGLNPELPPLE